MATTNPIIRLSGLARRLVQDGLLTEDQAQAATRAANEAGVPLVSFLVRDGRASALDVAIAASSEYGVPLFDLDVIDTELMPKGLVEEKLVRKHHALPLIKRGNRLFLAVSDPTNHQGLDEIKFHTGLTTDAVLVEEDKLQAAIENMLQAQDAAMSEMLDEDLENLDVDFADDDGGDDNKDANLDVDDAPVVRYVNKILLDAINSGTSDVHFEPYEKTFRVRFRQDGMLQQKATPPVNIAGRLTARLKVMARMNIAERRVPQDGRIKLVLSRNRSIDFRVNTCPTLYGEKVVLRILDSSAATLGVESL
ncbi:MAG: Flp pilus assembly complex ATPase component TadA, partial [Gammaproteobacteria bacterium]|nr:Flp pilus assembly complex ATPase component TadA [Gammaproteobacteria bacterium]